MKRNKMNTQKIKKMMLFVFILGLFSGFSFSSPPETPAAPSMKALIVTGQNNHDWKTSTPILKQILE
ncbi:MAG: hypothetical protein KAT69_08075, partial [Candidatus Aminicenantes bacterium]|nr:hypothetical protein [Candidatus Aminicenantes bacterium]